MATSCADWMATSYSKSEEHLNWSILYCSHLGWPKPSQYVLLLSHIAAPFPLLIGEGSAFRESVTFLTSCFANISSWGVNFCWNRFHTVAVHNFATGPRKYVKANNIGLALFHLVSKSLAAGPQHLGELLAQGSLSQEKIDIPFIRLEIIHSVYLLEALVLRALANGGNSPIDSDNGVFDDRSSCSLDLVANELVGDGDKPIDETDEPVDDMDEPVNDIGEVLVNGSLLCDRLSVETVQAEIARINMDDDEEVSARIGEAITTTEQSLFSFNASDEIILGMSQNTDNLELSRYKTRQSALLGLASTNRR